MLSLPARVRIFVAVAPVDFRRGFDGLYALVRDQFGDDPFSGHLFLFFNRAHDRVKILTWDRNGFWLHYKRLERGTFERIGDGGRGTKQVEIDRIELQLLLEGIALKSVKSKKHFVHEIRLTAGDGDATKRVEPAVG
jgi:transposase